MLDLICDKWQNNTNCDSSRKEFKLQTTNNLNHIEKQGDDDKNYCLYFANKNAQMIDGGMSE